MASNHASYAKIGLTVVFGAAAIVGALVYLGGAGGSEERIYAETYTDRSVSGLSVGSAVNFRGVKVGEVKEINFVGNKYVGVDPMDARRIYILMSFRKKDLGFYAGKADHLVKAGMRATVTASGITGLSRIELDIVEDAAPAQTPSWEPVNPYIPSAVSLLASFSDSATKVMNQINAMDISAAWSNVSAAVESLSRASESVMTTLETRRADIDRVVEDFTESAASVRELTADLKRNPSLLVRERIPARLDETE